MNELSRLIGVFFEPKKLTAGGTRRERRCASAAFADPAAAAVRRRGARGKGPHCEPRPARLTGTEVLRLSLCNDEILST